MKTIILHLIMFFFFVVVSAQDDHVTRIPFLGEQAPSFQAESTKGTINYPHDFFNKWRIIISHPGSFTPVCTSELIEMAYLQEKIKGVRAELIVISTDGVNSNLQWIRSMEEMRFKERETPKIDFPIVSDLGFNISQSYGMQHLMSNSTKNIRGVFIIDPDNKIRLITLYPSEIGRNTDEILRSLRAIQEVDRHDVLTPASWVVGDDVMLHPPSSQEEFERMKRRQASNQYFLDWYMWFKRN